MRRISALAGAAVALSMLAACATGTDGVTVDVRDLPGIGGALVDASGRTLYVTDRESDGTVRCVADCVSTWVPLTVPAGTIPTGGAGVTGALATVTRPDGANQVTYNGLPLYTFTPDGGVGKSTGNGVRDSFGGADFVWRAATATGSAPPPPDNGGGVAGY
jgi:predicted lipoprotein with Yx(FWY)xxD motif